MEFLLGAVVFFVLLRLFAGRPTHPLSAGRKTAVPRTSADEPRLPPDQVRASTIADRQRIQRGRNFKTMRLGSGSPRIDERRRGFRLIRGGGRERQA